MPPSPTALPIDALAPALVQLTGHAVLVAPPGSGKTTRVPWLLASEWHKNVVVLEPRRLAARLCAQYVAAELGEPLGGRVGYEVRFEREVSAQTQLRYVTEGVLTRRLLRDPNLDGVDVLVLDEFHERHLQTDVALAHALRLARTTRPDLRIIVMSATIDAEPIAEHLGPGTRILRAEGRVFPVAVEHLDYPDARPLPKQVVSAMHKALREPRLGDGGHFLVFLPGMAEIQKTRQELRELAATHDLEVLMLHGDLSAETQRAAFAPSTRRKVILSTNVAETSVTIPGVTCVIDSGLARVLRQRDDGLPLLSISAISRASADQRAGRAGRTQPGICLRLYTAHDYATRREHDVPELARTDLAAMRLELAAMGMPPHALPWLLPPPEAAVASAEALLRELDALDAHDQVTELGQGMLPLAVHPRHARVVLAAQEVGLGALGAMLAAVLEHRELRGTQRGEHVRSASDVLDDLELAVAASRQDLGAFARRYGVDATTLHAVLRTGKALQRALEAAAARGPRATAAGARAHIDANARGSAGARVSAGAGAGATPTTVTPAQELQLQQALLTGFRDRVARRRGSGREYLLCGGGSATLSEHSRVDAEFLLGLEIRQRSGQRGELTIYRASAIDPSWLLGYPGVSEQDELVWNREAQRVERRERIGYRAIALSETQRVDGARAQPEAAAHVLAREALAAGLERFVDAEALAAFRARVAFAAANGAPADMPQVGGDLTAVLGEACIGLVSFSELARAGLLERLIAQWAPYRHALDTLAPTHLALPGRKRAPIHYPSDGQTPWVASRLQDFFGLTAAPRIGGGRVALVVHLLAPNQRPVQITQDLPGFWQRHYPAVRKELMRKYPRHAWPENPGVPSPDRN